MEPCAGGWRLRSARIVVEPWPVSLSETEPSYVRRKRSHMFIWKRLSATAPTSWPGKPLVIGFHLTKPCTTGPRLPQTSRPRADQVRFVSGVGIGGSGDGSDNHVDPRITSFNPPRPSLRVLQVPLQRSSFIASPRHSAVGSAAPLSNRLPCFLVPRSLSDARGAHQPPAPVLAPRHLLRRSRSAFAPV